MKMREQNTTADPDRAYLMYATIVERDRLTLVLREWMGKIPPGPARERAKSDVWQILTAAVEY